MNILLLGVGGFIGSNLAEYLIKNTDHKVVGMDTDDEKVRDIDRNGGRFVFHQADIRLVGDRVGELVQEADVVVDLIAYANPSIYVSKPLDVVDLNFFQNLRLVLYLRGLWPI